MAGKDSDKAADFFGRIGKPRRRRSRMGRPSGNFSARNQIIRGAMDAFGRRGYAGTSVEDILDASGVSRRTFYRFFKNKDELYGLIFDRSVEILLGSVREAIDEFDEPFAKVEAGLEAYLRVNALAGPLARTLLTEQFRPDSPFFKRRQKAIDQFRKMIEAEVQMSDRGQPDPLLMGGLIAALDYVTAQIAIAADDDEWDIDRGKAVMMRMVAASLAQPGDPIPDLPLAPKARRPR